MNSTILEFKKTSIGLDVSKESISVYIPINNLDLRIDNTPKGLRKLLSKLKKLYKKEFKELVFVFEPTGSYSEVLKKFCANKKIKSFIINPKQSHNFAKSNGNRNKTDKVDAKTLSNAIIIAKDKEIKVPVIDPVVETIKERMSYYKFVVKQRVMTSNHLESLVTKKGDSFTIKSLKKEIQRLSQIEKEIIDSLKSMINTNEELLQRFEFIKSIKGVGDIAAIVLLHLFLKYPNANKKQLTSLTGLDPTRFDSGSSVRKRPRISKAGSSLYRSVLFMAAMVAIRHNEELKVFYDRLKENNKHTTQAQVAVIRKIIIIAHSLYKNKQEYDSSVYKKHCGVGKE